MATADDFISGANAIGGAVSDLFGAKASTASAGSYTDAATIAEQNAQLVKQATAIKETQQSRQIFQTIGAQRAGVGGAGFAESGTALDLLRSSASQGALAKAITASQGAITENAYAEQAGQFRGMADAATASGTAQDIGGLVKAAGGAWDLAKGASSLFSAPAAGTATVDAAGMDAALFGVGTDAAAGAAGAAGSAGVLADMTGMVGAGADFAAASAGTDLLSTALEVAACFITTAIMNVLGKPDDCDELQTIRAYRDGWLAQNHPEDIQTYYKIAPAIVASIDARINANKLWTLLYIDYLLPALAHIKTGENELAYSVYRSMVLVAGRMA